MTAHQPLQFSIDLAGQTALVTGASSGLGRRFAWVLAMCGARVGLVARRLDRLQDLEREITEAGGAAISLPADMENLADLHAVVDQLEARFGTPTILLNNAGMVDAKHATKLSVAEAEQIVSVNLLAPFLLSCEVARRLMAAKLPGRIVNIASMAAFDYGGRGATLYTTTKAALVRATEALALEWAGFGINVNAIAPGAFDTEMVGAMIERIGDPSAGYRRGRIGHPSQLDSTLLYLVSPSSGLVTGTCVRVDDAQNAR